MVSPKTVSSRSPQAKGGRRAQGAKFGSATPSRRAEIVNIAAKLFADRGFLGTTIRDIADAADILSGSLYHHFASKETIADEILAGYWNELLERYEAVIEAGTDPAQTLRNLIRESVLLLDPFEHAIRLMLNDWSFLATALPYIDQNLKRIQQTWTNVILAGMNSGQFDDTLDPVLAYRTIMSSITGTGRWYRPGGSLRIDELAEEMTKVFLGGLTARGTAAARTAVPGKPVRKARVTKVPKKA